MKSLFSLFVALLIVLSFSMAGVAQAHNTGSQQPSAAQKKIEPSQAQNVTSGGEKAPVAEKKMGPAEKALTFTGKVIAVDPADKTIVVKGKEGEKMFNVSDVSETFREGQTVHVTYRVESGKMVVLSVRTGMKTAMAGPRYGYDPYYGFDPHFYGYDPYVLNQRSPGAA